MINQNFKLIFRDIGHFLSTEITEITDKTNHSKNLLGHEYRQIKSDSSVALPFYHFYDSISDFNLKPVFRDEWDR